MRGLSEASGGEGRDIHLANFQPRTSRLYVGESCMKPVDIRAGWEEKQPESLTLS